MASAVVHYEPSIREAARKYRIRPSDLAGLMQVESAGRANAVSSAGAFGLTQFMPGTARGYGVQRGSSRAAKRSQIFGAAKYLRDLGYHSKRMFALAAYNGGPGNPQYGYARDVVNAAKQFAGFDRAGGGAPASRAAPAGQGLPAVSATATSTVSTQPAESAGTGIADQIRAEMAQRRQSMQVGSSGPAAPPFSAGPRMPQGLQGGVGLSPLGAPAGPKAGELDALLSAAAGAQGEVGALSVSATRTAHEPGVPAGGGAPAAGGRPGAPVAGKAWGGSKNVAALAFEVARKAGLTGGSSKRTPEHNRAVGGDPNSDHLTTNRTAWAWDFPTRSGEGAARRIARAYGIKGWSPNSYTRYTIKASNGARYSIQILWGASIGHDDHVHVGVRRA